MHIKLLFIPVLLALLGTGAYFGYAYYQEQRPASENEVLPNPDTPPPDEATVASVIDGITLKLDTGHIVRYLGVRTPTVKEEVRCFGKESVLANESIIGEQVRLEEDPLLTQSRDGAWTRYVFFTPDEVQAQEEQMPETTEVPEEEAEDQEEETDQELVSPTPTTQPDITEEAPDSPVDPVRGDAVDVGEGEQEDDDPDEIFVNERILEGGFGFPVVSSEMKYGERLLSAARYANATGKGLWRQCEVEQHEMTGEFSTQKVEECVIKGKRTVNGEQIYRLPECPAYKETIVIESDGDEWFCAEDTAQEMGFTKAPDCS